MTEIAQIILILIITYGHVKLYIDTGYQVPPELKGYYVDKPFGYAAFFDNGKFVNHIDLRQ